MDGWDWIGWDGISPDRSISRSPSGENKLQQKAKKSRLKSEKMKFKIF